LPALIAGLLLPSLAWVALDRSAWPWGQAWNGEVSVQLYYTLRHQPGQWLQALRAAFGSKPPAVAYLGQFFVPLRHLTGSIDVALRLSVLLAQLLTLALVWRTGRQLGSSTPLVPLAGCLLVAAAPLFVGLSHQYFAEPVQALAVAWAFYAALASAQWGRPEALGHLLGAAGLGMLAKASTPLYCLLPGLLAARRLLPGARQAAPTAPGALVRGLLALAAGGALAALAVAWYRHNFAAVYRDFLCQFYGTNGVLWDKLARWARALRNDLFLPVSFDLCVGLLAVAALCRLPALRGASGGPLRTADGVALCALAHVLAVLLTLAPSVNSLSNYLLPSLPALAYLLMWALERLRARGIAGVVVAVFALQWLVVHAATLGVLSRPTNLSHAVLCFDPDDSRAREVEAVVALTSEGGRTDGRYCLVGAELPWLNPNTLSYFAEKQRLRTGYRCAYTGLDYVEHDVGRDMRRIEDFKAAYVVTRESCRAFYNERINGGSWAVLQRLRRDPAWQERRLPPDGDTLLFERSAATQRPADCPGPGAASPAGSSAAADPPSSSTTSPAGR
jgi:hypothetical protein